MILTKPGGQDIGELAMHIVDGAEWYRFCLNGTALTRLSVPRDREALEALGLYLWDLDQELLALADAPDAVVHFANEDASGSVLRSTLLSQACYHATEHRAQIALTLDLAGVSGVDLDEYDFWAFESYERRGNP